MTGVPQAKLARSFYARPARMVAQDLLGKRLVRLLDGARLSGLIVEAEAYCDSVEPDLACHGSRNRGRPTRRTAVMFGAPGHAYVYFTYGMHWMLNIVTGEEGQSNAVLIRAVEPDEGESVMSFRRAGRSRSELTNGPAKVAQAFGINGVLNGADLCDPGGSIWLEAGWLSADLCIANGPRVGLGNTAEPWLSMPWRYWIADNPFVSR